MTATAVVCKRNGKNLGLADMAYPVSDASKCRAQREMTRAGGRVVVGTGTYVHPSSSRALIQLPSGRGADLAGCTTLDDTGTLGSVIVSCEMFR